MNKYAQIAKQSGAQERAELLQLHEWDELVFGGFYCMHCTPDDPYSFDDPIAWPCQPLREAGVTNEEAVEIIQAYREKVAAEYRAQKEAEKAEGQRKADEFNARYPVGTPVAAYPNVRPEHPAAASACKRLETTTRTPAWVLGHGEPVVSVEGYAGGICLTHVDVVEDGAR